MLTGARSVRNVCAQVQGKELRAAHNRIGPLLARFDGRQPVVIDCGFPRYGKKMLRYGIFTPKSCRFVTADLIDCSSKTKR